MRKVILTITILCYLHCPAQDEDFVTPGFNGEEEMTDEEAAENELLKVMMRETLEKLASYVIFKKNPERVIEMSETYAGVSFYAGILNRKNPSWENIREGIIKDLLPEYSDQGTFLETIYDREMMRDIDQYIDYMESITTYGLNITQIDREVRGFLSPEKGTADEYNRVEGEVLEEEMIGGLPLSEYQAKVSRAFVEVQNYVPTGDPAVDDQATMDIVTSILGESGETERTVLLINELMEEEWPEDDESLANEMMMEYIESYFEDILGNEEEEEEGEFGTGTVFMEGEDIAANENNPLMTFIADQGIENRDVVQRYGAVAQPFVDEYVNRLLLGNNETQEALTNFYKTWEELRVLEYADRIIEIEQITREILESGVDLEDSELMKMWDYFKVLWDQVIGNGIGEEVTIYNQGE